MTQAGKAAVNVVPVENESLLLFESLSIGHLHNFVFDLWRNEELEAVTLHAHDDELPQGSQGQSRLQSNLRMRYFRYALAGPRSVNPQPNRSPNPQCEGCLAEFQRTAVIHVVDLHGLRDLAWGLG